jgi:hypothetical protein
MIKILLWVFIAYGMSTIITAGAIFEKPRQWIIDKSYFWGKFIICMLCIPTWVGFFLSLVLGGLTITYFPVSPYIGWFFDGMFTAGAVWAINSLIEFFEESRIK